MSDINCNGGPITHPQRRIWYTEKIYPGTSLHNIGGSIRIKGKIDFNILEESINIFIKKNEGLRLAFSNEHGEIRQHVRDYERTNLDFIDFSQCVNPEEDFNKWIEKEAKKSFVLENGILFYFALFRISDHDSGYLVKFHHIIADGWSTNIMTEQICNNYMKLLNGEEIDDNLEPSYIEYILSEKKYFSSDRFLRDKAFWNEKFKNLQGISLNQSSDLIEGKRRRFELGWEISSKIKEFAENHKFSLNTFFVTLYLIYLYMTTQQENIVIGTPVLNRSGKKEKSTFGMFTSTMPFRFAIDEDLNILDTMVKVNEELKACYFHQKYPYDLLVQDLELRKKGYDTLFNTCVNYYNTRLNSVLNGFPIENTEFYNGNQVYSLQLIIRNWLDSGCLALEFDYKVNDYTHEQIGNIHAQLLNLIHSVLRSPLENVKNLSMLSDNEREKLLYQFNSTKIEYPDDKVIYQLFEEQVEKTPEKVAISFDKKELTYRELNRKANQLARYLVKRGVKRETPVGLLVTNSIEAVIGVLGILKAGGAYLPIDPGYPKDRICYMLENSGSALLLTNLAWSHEISFDGEVIHIDNQNIYIGNSSNLDYMNNPNDLAYIIYTSGSTGKPKGTMIEHQGLVNYIWWTKKVYVSNEDEIFPLYSSLAFDLTVTSLFTPLVSGCRIIVYHDSRDDEEYVLYRILKENKVTIVKLTPAHLSLLKDLNNQTSSIKRFIVGGEDLKVNLAKSIYESFNGNIEIINEYGPTETVVGCTIHRYNYKRDIRSSVPIGTPAANVQCYLLDKNLNPVPPNSIGELYIAGDGVARGYLKNPELTQEKFIDNPFIAGKKMYKTGDLARFIDGDKLEYIGRVDQQVKIRGYRIELGEIEKYLLNHEAIKHVTVIDFEDKSSNKHLCAYIVKKSEVPIRSLKEHLLRYVPDYMVPAYFIELDEIPLTINGKVNKELLLQPEIGIVEDTETVSYRDEKEKNLINAVCDVLNLQRVSVRQNFYHLGGDSIKALQIASKLSEIGLKIKLKDILSHPVMEEMALYIEERKGLAANQDLCEGSIRPTPIVSWFFSQRFANPNYYNQSILLELHQDIEVKQLEDVLKELIRYHDSLRLNYNSQTDELFYNNAHLNTHFHIQEYDLSDPAYPEPGERMRCIAEDLKAGFDIEKGILIKACVFNLGSHLRKLLIAAHHLVIDGVSWRIILGDMHTLLEQIMGKQEFALPAKTGSYQEWATLLGNYDSKEIREEETYWEQILRKNFVFPIDHDLGKDIVFSSSTLAAQMDEILTESLMKKANTPYNTETKDLLITSLLRSIKEFTGKEDLIIELESHGREGFEDIDISRTIGWFTSIYPFYINLKKNDLSDQIKQVKEELRKIHTQGIGFGVLKYLSRSLKDNDTKYIRFNYLGDFTSGSDTRFFQLQSNQSGNDSDNENSLTSAIDINCFVLYGKLNVLLTYSKNKFLGHTMERFLNKFIFNLKLIINHCNDKNSVEFTPSDFDTVDLSLEELERLFN